MYNSASFVCGLLFGIGLIVARMINPAKVLNFLDLAGQWDPSLALVMAGAIAIGVVAFSFARKRTRSILGAPMQLPTARHMDRRCALGSLTFGVGWGLAGFCPGPALVALGIGELKAVVFVISMLAGMAVFEYAERVREKFSTKPPTAWNRKTPTEG